MPNRPQSPLQTHSAPPLPQPAAVLIISSNSNSGRRSTLSNSKHLPPTLYEEEKTQWNNHHHNHHHVKKYNEREIGEMQKRLPVKDEKNSFNQQSSQLQRAIDPPQSLKTDFKRRIKMSHSPIKKKMSTRDDTSLVQDNEIMGNHLREVSPVKITQQQQQQGRERRKIERRIVSNNQTEWEEEEEEKEEEEERQTSPESSTPTTTAYEAALAKYGKKLLSMTQKQIQEKQQNRRASLSRRKAINEKYSELSRPSVGNGRSIQVTSTTQRENGSKKCNNHLSLHRKEGVNSVIGNGNNNNNNNNNNISGNGAGGVGVGLVVTELQKDYLNIATLHEDTQRKLSFDLNEATMNTRLLGNTEPFIAPTQRNKEKKKNEYRKDELKRDMKSSNLAVKPYSDIDDIYRKNYRRGGGYRSYSVGNVNGHHTSRDKRETTTPTRIKSKSRVDNFFFEAPLIEEEEEEEEEEPPYKSSSIHYMPIKDDNVSNDGRFIARPWLTPPRPLRRICTSEPCHPSIINYNTNHSKHVLSNPFMDTQSFYYDPWRRTSSATVPNNNNNNNNMTTYNSYSRSRSSQVLPTRRSSTGQQALVFIRPQEKPRPLPRRSEMAIRSDEDLWSVREASFRRRTSSEEYPRNSGNWDDHGIDIFITRADPRSGLERNVRRQEYESEGVGEGKRCVFTNVVPQYVLDGFAQRCLLRLAWRRWKEKTRVKQFDAYIHR